MVNPPASAPAMRAYYSPVGRIRMLGGDPALDFANTLHWRDGALTDFIPDFRSLAEWSMPAGLMTEEEGSNVLALAKASAAAAKAVHAAAIALRGVWRDRLAERTGIASGDRAGAKLRQLLASALGDGGLAGGEDEALLRLPLMRVALAITSLELIPVERRIGRCAADQCGGYFLDNSRSKPRRWCSMDSCGNRAKVRGYRDRFRAEEVTPGDA
jgi:predicted RNA-binding Zn ribbon-like protein